MTIYTPNQSGNWSNASIWDTAAFVSNLVSTSNVNTAGINSETFTAPNTTNAITGCWVCIATVPNVDWTLQIVESGVPVGAAQTFDFGDMPPSTQAWIYFRFTTPYVYTTTAAGAYRFVLKSVGSNSGSVYTGAGGVGIIPTDDRHAVPVTAPQVWMGAHNGVTPITVTVDGTAAVANGISASSQPQFTATTTNGMMIGGSSTASRCQLIWDQAASATLTYGGHILLDYGGEIQMGTVGSPYPAANIASLINSVDSNNAQMITARGNGFVQMVGAPIASGFDRSAYVSGSGTAASPLVLADAVDWNVGDKIVITATSSSGTNYNEAETRYIRVKNSATSYTLANTPGGVEAGLSFTHNTNAIVYHLTRNVRHYGTGATNRAVTTNLNLATTNDSVFSWCNCNNYGNRSVSFNFGTFPTLYGLYIPPNIAVAVDYVVFDELISYGLMVATSTAKTYNNLIFANYGTNTTAFSAGLYVAATAIAQTFVDMACVRGTRMGVEYRGVNCVFTNPVINACNNTGVAVQGGFSTFGASPFTMTNPKINACRIGGVTLAGAVNSTLLNGEIGTQGPNTADVLVTVNTANYNILFDNCNFGSATLVTGHTAGASGATLLLFNRLNQTANNHRWYTELGSAQSTGAGLADTTVRTPGTLNIRLNPENAVTGFQWEYLIPAVPGKAVQSFLFIQKNSTFGTDVATVELFLPGSTVADATATVSNTTGSYLVYSVAANYAGTENLYARVRVTAKSVAAGAYLYVADISNGTNDIINLKTWYRGKPSSIMFEQLGDAGAVWAYLLDGSYTASDMMKLMSAVLAGKVSNAGTNNETFRNLSDTLNRLINTVDASGNRTALTYNLG